MSELSRRDILDLFENTNTIMTYPLTTVRKKIKKHGYILHNSYLNFTNIGIKERKVSYDSYPYNDIFNHESTGYHSFIWIRTKNIPFLLRFKLTTKYRILLSKKVII